MDLIDRQGAIKAICKALCDHVSEKTRRECVINYPCKPVEIIKDAPSEEPKVIHCKDCKWWDSTNGKTGYCHAAKHGHYSTHWEISIYRKYDGEFYCADAERRTDE